MAFSSTRIVISVAIISIYLLDAISCRNVQSPEKGAVLHEIRLDQNTIIEDRAFASDFSGRSLIIKSLLLAPLGIALIVLAGLILLPVPVISTGRRMQNNHTIDLVKKVIASEECVERIACEVSNFTRNYESTSWIPRRIEFYLKNTTWLDKVSRGFGTADHCNRFKCHPMKQLSKNRNASSVSI